MIILDRLKLWGGGTKPQFTIFSWIMVGLKPPTPIEIPYLRLRQVQTVYNENSQTYF